MKTPVFLAVSMTPALAAGTVLLPTSAVAETRHGGGGEPGGGYYGGICGQIQLVLGTCGPYGY